MKEFKKGDKILVEATVMRDGLDSDGDVVLR